MLAGICDLAVPEAFAGCIALRPGAVFLVLIVTPPTAPIGYGIVSLADDGTLLHNGNATSNLIGLVQTTMRTLNN